MVFLVSKVQGYSVSIEYTLYRLLITWLCPFGTYINEVWQYDWIQSYSRLCCKKNWREASTWNPWNQACLAYKHEFMKKLRFSSYLKAKVYGTRGHQALLEHTLSPLFRKQSRWFNCKATHVYFTCTIVPIASILSKTNLSLHCMPFSITEFKSLVLWRWHMYQRKPQWLCTSIFTWLWNKWGKKLNTLNQILAQEWVIILSFLLLNTLIL